MVSGCIKRDEIESIFLLSLPHEAITSGTLPGIKFIARSVARVEPQCISCFLSFSSVPPVPRFIFERKGKTLDLRDCIMRME